jgi:predicted alpha/beta-fold hydrolase
LDDVINQIHKKYPGRKLFAIALSLGGNILANFLGSQGVNCKLSAAVVLNSPLLVFDENKRLKPAFFGIYN